MIADIQPPNLETRIAILQTKAATMGRQVPDDVLAQIAQRAHRNIRDMEGALTKVLAHAELLRRPLNVALVEDALSYLSPAQGRLTLPSVLNAAAAYFGLTAEELTGRNRSARIALQRQIVMYLMREETDASLPQIGEALGGRDHTTIIHGYEKVVEEMNGNPDLNRQINELRIRLYEPVKAR
jgi:chromosomal replication initiator protein